MPADRLLRTKNDAANHLGLPLPSGRRADLVAFGFFWPVALEAPESDPRRPVHACA